MNKKNIKKIIFVDDDLRILEMVNEYFSIIKPSIECLTFSSPIEALKVIKKEKIEMVLTDLKMPEMNGIEFLKEIKKIKFDLPVVIISAYATVSNAVDALKLGAEDVLLKPINLESIKKTVYKFVRYSNEEVLEETEKNINEDELFLSYYLLNDKKEYKLESWLKHIVNSIVKTYSVDVASYLRFRSSDYDQGYFFSSKTVSLSEVNEIVDLRNYKNLSLIKDDKKESTKEFVQCFCNISLNGQFSSIDFVARTNAFLDEIKLGNIKIIIEKFLKEKILEYELLIDSYLKIGKLAKVDLKLEKDEINLLKELKFPISQIEKNKFFTPFFELSCKN